MTEAAEPGMVDMAEAVEPGMVSKPDASHSRMEPDMCAPMRHRARVRAGKPWSTLRLRRRWRQQRPANEGGRRHRYRHLA